jgi:hypothetical protein
MSGRDVGAPPARLEVTIGAAEIEETAAIEEAPVSRCLRPLRSP